MSLPTSLPARVPSPLDAPALRWDILGSGWIAERFIQSVRAHTTHDLDMKLALNAGKPVRVESRWR